MVDTGSYQRHRLLSPQYKRLKDVQLQRTGGCFRQTFEHGEGVRSSRDTTFTFSSTKPSKDTRHQQQLQNTP